MRSHGIEGQRGQWGLLAIGGAGGFAAGAPFGMCVVPRITHIGTTAGLEDAEPTARTPTVGSPVAIAIAIAIASALASAHRNLLRGVVAVAAGHLITRFGRCE